MCFFCATLGLINVTSCAKLYCNWYSLGEVRVRIYELYGWPHLSRYNCTTMIIINSTPSQDSKH